MHNKAITAETMTELNSESLTNLLVGSIVGTKHTSQNDGVRLAVEFLYAWAILFTHARDLNVIDDVSDFLPEGFSLVAIAKLVANTELEEGPTERMNSYLKGLPGVKHDGQFQFPLEAIVAHYQTLFIAKLPGEFFEASRANDVQLSVPQVFLGAKTSPLKDLKNWHDLACASGAVPNGSSLDYRLNNALRPTRKVIEGVAVEHIEEGVTYVNCQIRCSRNLDHSAIEEAVFINCNIYLSGARIQFFSPLFFQCEFRVLEERDCSLFDAAFVRCDLLRMRLQSAEQVFMTHECWIGEPHNRLLSTNTRFYPIVINQEVFWLCEAHRGPILIRNGVAYDLTNRTTTWVAGEQSVQAYEDADSIGVLPSSLWEVVEGIIRLGNGARSHFGHRARHAERLN